MTVCRPLFKSCQQTNGTCTTCKQPVKLFPVSASASEVTEAPEQKCFRGREQTRSAIGTSIAFAPCGTNTDSWSDLTPGRPCVMAGVLIPPAHGRIFDQGDAERFVPAEGRPLPSHRLRLPHSPERQLSLVRLAS